MASFINENGKEREDVFYENTLVRDFNASLEKSDYHVFGLIGEWGSIHESTPVCWSKSNTGVSFCLE